MKQNIIDLANRTLRIDLTFRPALCFELDENGEPRLVDIAHERRTICTVRADTLAALAGQAALIDVMRMLWNVARRELAAGKRVGVEAGGIVQ